MQDHYRKLAARMAAIVASNADPERRAKALAYHLAANNVAHILSSPRFPNKDLALLGMWHGAIARGQTDPAGLDMAHVYWRAYRRIGG